MAPASWTIYPLLLGEAEVPRVLDVFWSLSRDKSVVTVPILAWLLVPDGDGKPILIDTGFSDAERVMRLQRLGPHRSRPEWSLEAQLANHGIDAGSIETVILTHLHYDHAGACDAVPNARLVVQRSELQAAAAPIVSPQLDFGGGALFYDRRDIAKFVDPFWPRLDLLEGEAEVAPGVRCVLFAATHTPGSQAVYVRTSEGTAVILGDIARNVELNILQGVPPGLYYDLEATRRAMARIRRDADFPATHARLRHFPPLGKRATAKGEVMTVRVVGLERVALQVRDLDDAISLFSRLLGTTFHRTDLQLGERRLQLGFSPLGIELLQEDPSGSSEGLRSFHLRVDSIDSARAAVLEAGAEVVTQFRVGAMEHLVTRIGPFRVIFVAYPGSDGLAALAATDEGAGGTPATPGD